LDANRVQSTFLIKPNDWRLKRKELSAVPMLFSKNAGLMKRSRELKDFSQAAGISAL